MAIVALVLAVLSFVLVERPIRRWRIIVRRPLLGLAGAAGLIAVSLAVASVGTPLFTSLHTGPAVAAPSAGPGPELTTRQLASDLVAGVRTRKVPANIDPSLTAAAQDKPLIDRNGCLLVDAAVKSRGCIYGDPTSRTSVVLFGDSHGAAWFPAVNRISQQEHWRLVVLAKSGCPAAAVNVVRFGRVFRTCPEWRRDAERQIAALHPALVVVASSQYIGGARPLSGVPTGYGSTWQNGTEATFRFLRRSATHVVFISDVPRLSQPAPDCVSAHPTDVPACTLPRRAAVQYPRFKTAELTLAARNHIDAIDPFRWFCTRTRCPVIVGNILLYRDSQHFVPQWSLFLVPVLKQAITHALHAAP